MSQGINQDERLAALAQRFAQLTPAARRELLQKLDAAGIDFALLPIAADQRRGERACASYAQRRLWFLWRLDPHSGAYNVAATLSLRGPLDIAALQRTFDALRARHAALRTVFGADGEEVWQYVREHEALPIRRDDLRALAADERARRAAAIAAEEAGAAFDLERGPLLRLRLLALGDAEHELLVTMHHIVADGWSMDIVIRELALLYAAARDGRDAQLPALPIEYADYAQWQRNWLEAGESERQLQYWRRKLGEEHPPLPLPSDRARPAVQSFRGADLQFELGALAPLQHFAQQRQATPFMLVLTAFKVLLYRYTGQGDVRVGVPIANRQRAETEALVGFFVNTQVLRSELDGALDFEEVLRRVRSTALEAQAHQDMPFEQLVDALNPTRSLAHNPLFQVKYNYQRWHHGGARAMADLELEIRAAEQHSTHFDLGLDVTETGDGLRGRFVYATDLFDAATIERMARHLRDLLQALIAAPARAIGDVDYLSAPERAALRRWRERPLPLPAATALDLFRQAARGDAIAARDAATALTWNELDRHSERIAHYLRARGCVRETRVGLCAARTPAMVAALLGILKAGATCVPLDPQWPAPRIDAIAEDCGLALLLHDGAAPQAAVACVALDAIGAAQGAAAAAALLPQQIAYIIYTSGSTGRPKGVAVSHAALAHYVAGVLHTLQLPPHANLALVSTIGADLGHTMLFGALCGGHTLHLVDADRCADPDRFAEYMAAQRIDALKIVPTHLNALLQAQRAADVLPRHTLVLGGETCPWPLFERLRALRPPCRVVNHYGPTETTVGALAAIVAARGDCASAPLGTPLPNARVYLLDERMNPVPVGVAGQIHIGGAGVARGYWQRPGLTAERFVPDPFEAGARLYRSGDRARYRDDGAIEFLGRADHQVKIRGFRVEPDEVAQVLRQLPDIAAAAVLARDGADGARLVAYCVPRGAFDAAALRAELARRLPDYLVPAAFVALPALPLTANGKLDRNALPPPDAAPADRHTAPRDAIERTLADIWQAVLKVDRVGVHDNFFELGGDSILSLQIIARARRQGLVIAPKLLFEKQTIAELAAALQADAPVANPAPSVNPEVAAPATAPWENALTEKQWRALPVARSEVRALYPLTPLQQGLLLHTLLQPGAGTHINQRSCVLRGPFDAAAFRAAWQRALDAHAILRTLFVWEGGDEPLQVVCARAPLAFEEVDWRDRRGDERALSDYLAADRARGFDPGRAPLMRVAVIRTAEEQWFVVWTLHHLLLDGWSSAQLLNEVFADYAARREGGAAPWPARPPFSAYIDWLRGRDSDGAERFWRERLGDLEQPTLLAQHAAPARTGRGRASLIRQLPGAFSAALREFAQQQRVTLNSVLQGAIARLLGAYTRQRDVVLGTTVSGRSAGPDGIQDMIGLLINTLPLRVRIDAAARVGDWLRALQAQHSAARDFEYAPLTLAQSCSALARGTPLFDTLLVFQNYPVDPELAARIGAAGMDDLQSFEQTPYPLTIMVVARGESLRIRFDYDLAHYDAAAIERIAAQLEQILRDFVEDPARPLQDVSLLGAAQRRHLLDAWNDSARPLPDGLDLIDLIEARAASRPDAPALLHTRTWSYRALNARANRFARRLRALGAGPDTIVAVCLERGADLIAALLGVLKAGAAYLPLDPTHPRERLAQMLDDAQPCVLLTQAHRLPALAEVAGPARIWCPDRDAAELEHCADDDPPRTALPGHLAYCIYTSGSTGRPKGVAVARGALLNFLLSVRDQPGLVAEDRVLALTAITFDIAALEIYLPLICGAAIVLADRALANDPQALLDHIARERVSVVQATPAAWRLLSEQPQFDEMSLRLALCGGEALAADLAAALTRCARWAWNLYGPTETTVWSARQLLDGGAPALGHPLGNTRLHVLDEYLQPAPIGVTGELYIGGLGLARGYWRRPDLSAARFVPDPFARGQRLYRSGDLALRREDGTIEYRGRIDQQVKIRGFRIEPGEIEAQLLARADIAAAAVIARDTAHGPQLVAYVVARRGHTVEPALLRRQLAAVLPEHMVPAQCVLLEQLPLTPSGKLDRKALPDPHWQGRAYVAPTTPLQQRIAEIWRDALQVERVGVDDNFFELGGHSLLAARVTTRLRRALDMPVPFERIFTAATLGALAASLEGESPATVAADIAVMDDLLAELE